MTAVPQDRPPPDFVAKAARRTKRREQAQQAALRAAFAAALGDLLPPWTTADELAALVRSFPDEPASHIYVLSSTRPVNWRAARREVRVALEVFRATLLVLDTLYETDGVPA